MIQQLIYQGNRQENIFNFQNCHFSTANELFKKFEKMNLITIENIVSDPNPISGSPQSEFCPLDIINLIRNMEGYESPKKDDLIEYFS